MIELDEPAELYLAFCAHCGKPLCAPGVRGSVISAYDEEEIPNVRTDLGQFMRHPDSPCKDGPLVFKRFALTPLGDNTYESDDD